MSSRQIAILLLVIGSLWETGILKSVFSFVPGIVQSAPFKTDQLSVLIVRGPARDETDQQTETISSTTWMGVVPKDHWRVLDHENDIGEKEEQWVKDAFAVKREVLPWVVISNGRTGYSGPLPENEAALIELIKKYGA